MLPSYLRNLLNCMSQGGYITANRLSAQLGISPKTVRMRIKELNIILKEYDAVVTSKPRYGYTLECTNPVLLETLFSSQLTERDIPNTAEDRIRFLLMYFLEHDGYIKQESLCDLIFVSKPTLSSSMKKVEEIVNQYSLRIERRPNYGIRLSGDEFDFRRCIRDYSSRYTPPYLDESGQDCHQVIAQILYRLLETGHVRFTEVAFQNVIDYIDISIRRIRQGRFVRFPKEMLEYVKNGDQQLTNMLISELTHTLKISFDLHEQVYIHIHLAGHRMIGDALQDEPNFVIHENIDRLVLQMLELIYNHYRIDFRSNFDLRMELNQHLVPLDIRIRYNIPLKNPLLSDIQKNYILAYTIASHASTVLSEYYQKNISDDEISYLALVFALELEKMGNWELSKSNLLIVCSSGKGSSRLLMYKYKKVFGKYLNKIFLCNQFELEHFDFSTVHYIVTTVPITRKVPVPILEVGMFLEQDDVQNIWHMLQTADMEYLARYYKEDAFLQQVHGTNREEIIRDICAQISFQRSLPEGFCEAVLKREEMGATDFGNKIAMCHPYRVMTQETFVYIAVLDEPILWGRNMVQVVFLIAVGEQEDETIQQFYNVTTQLFLRPYAIDRLIQEPSFKVLMELLTEQGSTP